MTTTIQNFYKESNVITDRSGDYRVITMPVETYNLLMCTLQDAKFNGYNKQRAQRLIDILDKAKEESKATWY